MATHAIGTGTQNLALNVQKELRADIGRLATMEGARSINQWIKTLVEERVREARASGTLDQAGQLIMRLPAWLLWYAGVAGLFFQIFAADSDVLARARSTVRTSRGASHSGPGRGHRGGSGRGARGPRRSGSGGGRGRDEYEIFFDEFGMDPGFEVQTEATA